MRFDGSIKIETRPGVYEPAEDSVLMIEALEVRPGEDVLEVGCGTGIIALHCAKAGARVTASDVSIEAIECTRDNAERNDLDIMLVESDLLERLGGTFEAIVFNPPYLPDDTASDPRWTGGQSGLETTLRFLGQCKRRLAPGGRVYIIISSLAESRKFELAVDEMGYDREIMARRRIFFEELIAYKLRMLTKG